jgi:calcineurin-like phosphoesterase family protein
VNFFTSDLHFWHRNVIAYCNRPFSSVEEMNEGLISRWNSVVTAEDTVFVLGDVCFGGRSKLRPILERLLGEVILVKGNHDHTEHTRLFKTVVTGWHLKLGGEDVTLSHYPFNDLRFPDRSPIDNGQWLLHGHVHCGWQQRGRMINVGVDVWDYTPVSEAKILERIKEGTDVSRGNSA